MSVVVETNDPSTTGVNATTGDSSLTDSNATDLQGSLLTLLVAQLEGQDLTNPLQDNELTTQLMQISTVSGIGEPDTTLGSISGQIDDSQSLQVSTLIGHSVTIPGTAILTGKETEEDARATTTLFGVELQQPADKVTTTITDKDDRVIRTIDVGGLRTDAHTFTWDGIMTDGTGAPSGSYNVSIAASNGGTQLVVRPLQFALVQDIIRSNGGNTLDLGTYGTTTFDGVRRII